MIFCKHRQYVSRVKAVEIVNKGCRLAQPLPVKLAPHSLCPACIGNGEVQTVRVNIVPVFRCVEVPQRVFIVMRRNFRVAACARCKEHKHKVVAAGGVRRSFIVGAVKLVFLIKAAPALALAVYNKLYKRLAVILFGNIGLVGGVTVRRADNRLNARRPKAVAEIVLLQLIGGRNCNRAQLIKPQHCKPELIVAFQHQHYAVAFFNAE